MLMKWSPGYTCFVYCVSNKHFDFELSAGTRSTCLQNHAGGIIRNRVSMIAADQDHVTSLPPVKCDNNFKSVIFKFTLQIDILSISWEFFSSHCPNGCCPRSLSPYDITGTISESLFEILYSDSQMNPHWRIKFMTIFSLAKERFDCHCCMQVIIWTNPNATWHFNNN